MAAMALSWLVLIIYFLTHIQGQQFSYLNEQIPIMETDTPTLNWTGIFPSKLLRTPCVSPIDQSKIDQVQQWYDDSTDDLLYAQGELEKLDDTPAEIDWKVSLYQLIIAYIVNFRDAEGPVGGLPISDRWIKPAAAVFDLEYIAFTDLSRITGPFLHSGPFCGVFISKGEKPFMILSFKGTTILPEGATNLHVIPTQQTDNNLYNQSVHLGMYRGLFEKIFLLKPPAIDVIWSELDRVATEVLGGSVDSPVPLYVSGHSLGAGYAQLAYVELFRRLNTSNTPKAYRLKSLYAFAAPRVAAILGTGFAQTVKDVFEGSGKPIFRYSNEYDVVPFAPGIVTKTGKTGDNVVASGWVHLDGGYILRRNASEAPYWTPDTTEICRLPKGDQDGRTSWEHHFPEQYYYSIKKIIDPGFDDPDADWPPPSLEYPPTGGSCPDNLRK